MCVVVDGAMVQPYFIAAPVGLGALVLQRTFRRKKGPRDEEVRRRDGDGDDTAFACERVCSSDRLIKRLGDLSKVRPVTSVIMSNLEFHHVKKIFLGLLKVEATHTTSPHTSY